MTDYKFIVSLTTIPTKFDGLYLTIDSLITQNVLPEIIIVNIPKLYSMRFDTVLPLNKIIDFQNKYAKHNVYINLIDEDFGPGTKLLGLFYNNVLADYDDENTFIILVDDDLIYKPNMIEYFLYVNKFHHNNVCLAGYFGYRFNNIQICQGADGLFMKKNKLTHFLQYYNEIKHNKYINYHDDFYISFYFNLLNQEFYHMWNPNGGLIYSHGNYSQLDALHNLHGEYNRDNLNKLACSFLNELKDNGVFNFIQ
jgi:hypothetical protein